MTKKKKSPNPKTVTITYPDQPNSRSIINEAKIAGIAEMIILIDASMVATYERANERINKADGKTKPSTRVSQVIL